MDYFASGDVCGVLNPRVINFVGIRQPTAHTYHIYKYPKILKNTFFIIN